MFVCPVLSNDFPISFTRNKLLDIRNSTPDNLLPTFEHSDVLLDILVGGAAFLYKRSRRRKRGKRAGVLVKSRQRGLRTPLPSIHLANLRSLANKSDELQLLTRTNKDFLNSAALCFMETWLNGAIPDSALHLSGFQLFRADRVTESSGTMRGDGLCFYINEGWCTDVTVLKKMCCPILEALFINCKPFYSPRDFSSFILVSVYIPLDARVSAALELLANKKAPGPDGFPAEFYKEFWAILAPTFYRMLQETKKNGRLPPNMNSANISLLLKPGKDPVLPTSYRPISLINVDTKIICKAISKRIEKITPLIIHSDQTGFIKGRHSSTNTCRLLNLIDYSCNRNLQITILSLDAEKAFDRVNWNFLFATLHKFGFGNSFINWLKILYNSPIACVRTNAQTSSSFYLKRGTRQGCPLSPSLFAIFIEPLAAAIRQATVIKGIKCKNVEHKVSLYADDVLLFLQHSQITLSDVITLINSFSRVSDYSINWLKSTVLPINYSFQNSSTPLQSGNIKYLGINLLTSTPHIGNHS